MELSLVKKFGWSLYDIDRTDIHSLIPFVIYAGKYAERENQAEAKNEVYIDQLDL